MVNEQITIEEIQKATNLEFEVLDNPIRNKGIKFKHPFDDEVILLTYDYEEGKFFRQIFEDGWECLMEKREIPYHVWRKRIFHCVHWGYSAELIQ